MLDDGNVVPTRRAAVSPVDRGADFKECEEVDDPGDWSISKKSVGVLKRPFLKNVISRHSSRNVSHWASSTRYRRSSFSSRSRKASSRGSMASRVFLSKMAWESYCAGAGGWRKQATKLEVGADRHHLTCLTAGLYDLFAHMFAQSVAQRGPRHTPHVIDLPGVHEDLDTVLVVIKSIKP